MSEKFEKLTDFERELLKGIEKNAKGHSKFCIYNAIHHLKMAFKIKELDPEMALFRAITAEEELARAIFIILKDHGYKNMNKIKDKEHKYKQSLPIFIGLIQDFFYKQSRVETFPLGDKIKLKIDENQLLVLGLTLKSSECLMSPIPPLNFKMELNGKEYYFQKEIFEFLEDKDFKIFEKSLEDKVNFRNKILYAQNDGRIEISSGLDDELNKYYNSVMKLIIIYSLIYPHKKDKSDFIQNVINAFLFVMLDISI